MKKQKLTLQQKLERRNFKIPNRFIYFLYKTISAITLERRYNIHNKIIDDINDCKGPCFLIYNHGSRRDHVLFSKAAYPRRLNILAGYNEFFRSHLQLPFRLANIIPKKNYANDMTSMKAMAKIIKKGGCVCFSPEGTSSIFGHNQPIVAGTAHFLKHFGVPVYFLKIEGSYLTNNKIYEDDRKGRIDTTMSLLFSKEQIQSMSEEEIDLKINTAFRHDDYEWNKTQRIKFETKGRICTNLQDICYKCPKCGAELEMEAEGDHIECKKCNNGAKMNDYYDFIPYNKDCVIPESPSKWADWERVQVIKEIRENPDYSFTEEVVLGCLPEYEYVKGGKVSVECGKGKITINHSGIHFVGEKFGKPFCFDWDYNTVYTLPIVTDVTFFCLYINGEFHTFLPARRSVGKMLLTVEEMHRLHVNTWKNFPWNDYMYAIDNKENK